MKPTDNEDPRIGINNVSKIVWQKAFVPQIEIEVKIFLDVTA